jgi:hypothetical protein
LRRQRRTGDAETRAERDHQEHEGKTDRHGGDRRRAQPSDPECVGQLVTGLQQVAERDRDRKPDQRGSDRSLEEELLARMRHVARVLSARGEPRTSKCQGAGLRFNSELSAGERVGPLWT